MTRTRKSITTRKIIFIMFFLPVLLLSAAQSFGAMTLHVTTEGDGKFILDGDELEGVAAVDITINYDAALLANPKVEVQGGTLTDVSAQSPGALTVKISRPDPDMMLQLQLAFDKRGDAPGGLREVTTTATDTAGKSYRAPANIFLLTPPAPEGQSTQSAGEDIAVSSTLGPSFLTKREKSVLERFEKFRGPKGLKELAALFKRRDRAGVAQDAVCLGNRCEILFERLDAGEVTQEPAIALSDGKTPVEIGLLLRPEEGEAPEFSLSAARAVSLRKTGENSWTITAVPDKGTWEAELLVGLGRKSLEFPLVVAPPVQIRDNTTEGDFPAALNEYLADRAAGYGLQGRAFQRHFHEYIFTANYLAKRGNNVIEAGGVAEKNK